jgi:stage V sporulation protein SpoVS
MKKIAARFTAALMAAFFMGATALAQTYTPALSGLGMSVNPYVPTPAFPGAQPFIVSETVTGTCTTSPSNCYYNALNIPSDNAVIGSGTSGTFGGGTAFYIFDNFGGAAMTGGRGGLAVQLNMTATTGNTAAHAQYSSMAAYANANASDNGTGTSLANSRGNLDAVNFIAQLGASATNWTALQGGEVDIAIASGGSSYEKVGWQIVQLASDAVRGAVYDTAIGIDNQGGAIGWTNGILFGGLQGAWPFYSGSVIITCATSCGSATSFIDMTNASFSGSLLKGPQFNISGVGAITSGSNGGNSGGMQMMGSTSGSSTINVSSTGSLQLNNNVGGATMTFNDAGNGVIFQAIGAGASAQSVFQIANTSSSTSPPVLSAVGIPANINIALTAKGTGTVQFGNAGSFSANGSVATVLGSLGPAGSHTTVQTWLTIVDSGGTTRYIPAF